MNRKNAIPIAIILLIILSYLYNISLEREISRLPMFISGSVKENMNVTTDELIFDKEEHEETKKGKTTKMNVYARSACLIDADSNRLLWGKDENTEVAMASTTKIMTCIVALEYGKLDDIVTFSSRAASMPDVQLNAKKGEQFKLKDLLHSLMLESHNDTAVAIAEHIGGSVEGFAKLMNKKAKELGCKHTQFVTPNGLDAEGHYTTAYELACIGSYAIQNKTFVEITNTPNLVFHEINSNKQYMVTNKNRFLCLMEGAMGIKTGFTNDAGYCFVGALKRDGKTLICSVLGSGWPPHKTYKWTDTTKLMEYGLNHYMKRELYDEEKVFEPVWVKHGKQKAVPVTMQDTLSVLAREDEKIHVVYEIPSTVNAPVKKGAIVGVAKYYIDDDLYKKIPIYTTESVEKIDYHYIFENLYSFFSRTKNQV